MRNLWLLSLPLALLLSAGNSFAIGEQYGRITGITYNQDGAILAGVSLTLKSSSLIGGPRKLATAEDGSFSFNNLPTGKYNLLVEQPGLKSIDKRGIVVSVGKTVSLYLTLELPTGKETVVVIADRPVLDTTDMTQGGSFSAELASDVPTGRSYQNIASFLPGVVNVRGGNPDIHGGTFRNNRYLVDGLDITDPVTLTFSANINFDAIQEVEVLTGGLPAEYNALGGIINVVTKSGSNNFELDASYLVNNKTLSPVQNFGGDALNGALKNRAIDTTIFATSQANVNVGGPIVKDKLWYYASLQKVDNITSSPVAQPFVITQPPFESHGLFGRLKLTYQPSQSHTITAAYSTDPTEFSNIIQSSFRFVDPACAVDINALACKLNNTEDHRVQGGFFTSLRWDWVVNSNMLFRAQAGVSKNALIGFPENTAFQDALALGAQQDVFGDVINPINLLGTNPALPNARRDLSFGNLRTGISSTFFEDIRTRVQLDSALTYLKDNLFGSHEFKVGIQAAPTFNSNTDGTPGFARLDDVNGQIIESPDGNGFRYDPSCNSSFNAITRTTNFPDVDARREGCLRMVSFAGAKPSENTFTSFNTAFDVGVFIQDQWKPTPFLTIQPGFRVDTFTSANLIDENLDGNYRGEGEKSKILGYTGIGPRLGVAWDPTKDGKTLLSAYVGQVTESGNLVIPSFAGKSALISVFDFNAAGGGFYEFGDPSQTFGGDAGTQLACDESLKDNPITAPLFEECRPPVLRELSVKAERQIGDATKLGVSGIWRRQSHMFEDDEANLIFDETGQNVIGGLNGDSTQSIFRLRTPDEAFVRYLGMDIYLQGKPSERSSILASYTLSLTEGSKDENTNTQFTAFMDNPRQNEFFQGPLPSHRPHVLKVVGSYNFDFGLTMGATYQYQTGQRFDRLFFNEFNQAFNQRETFRGFDPGDNLNEPGDDVVLKLPDSNQIDLRAQYDLAPLTGQKLSFFADIFNALNVSAPTNVIQQDGDTFKSIIGRQAPLRVQLGVRYIY